MGADCIFLLTTIGLPLYSMTPSFFCGSEEVVMRRPSTAFCCLLLVLLTLHVGTTGMFQCAWGQEVTASITGTVTDPSGAAVSGATVTATSVERGLNYTAVTNDSGLYRIAPLPVGTYSLKIEKSGIAVASH